jgi:hypothetical protein
LFYTIRNVQGAKPYFARAFAIISDLLGAWARILAVLRTIFLVIISLPGFAG